jgi:hypothetical protein
MIEIPEVFVAPPHAVAMDLGGGVLICRGGTPWQPPLHRPIQVPTPLAKDGVECHPYKLGHYHLGGIYGIIPYNS